MKLTCPGCGTAFVLSESEQESLYQQVRNEAFEQAVAKQVADVKAKLLLEQDVEMKSMLLQAQKEQSLQLDDASQQLQDLKMRNLELQHQLDLQSERIQYEIQSAVVKQKSEDEYQLRQVETELNYYKDLKTRMSTKMVGETLEQHCQTQFNQIRMTAFPHAYFEKDNDAKTGSKGDFIFRESSDDLELLSIMFEMKNEMDTTVSKHKNEDFLKELDRDRREKNCEYAVLVSLLESDSELYNTGIVDVSYRYPKMYVIRPQFFIPMITLLRNAAVNAMDARRELARLQHMDMDVVRFEQNLMDFKENISRNYDLASRQFSTAVDEIDKSIDHLQKVKKSLLSSERNLRLLSDKSEKLSVEKLTKDSPSVREMFCSASR